jgi:hypothetical protein
MSLPSSVFGFTGTQKGMTGAQYRRIDEWLLLGLLYQNSKEFHHGLCIGSDAQAHWIARRYGYRIIGHPPINRSKIDLECEANCDELMPPKEYLDRNTDIAKVSSILLAAPKEVEEQLCGSGTWATIRRGRKYSDFVSIVFPNGDTRHEQRTS